MKCYAVQLPDGNYLADVKSQPISWRSPSAKATQDITRAKHYKTEKIAKATLKRQATERRNNAKRQREQYEKRTANQQPAQPAPAGNVVVTTVAKTIVRSFGQRQQTYDYLIRNAENYEACADFIDTMTVIEVDVPTPTFIQKAAPDVKFEESQYKVGFSVTKSQGNCYCKCCGLYFKKIPHLMFGAGYKKNARICPWCIKERAHEADKILDELDADFRESIEAERFIHRMG